MRKSDGPWTSGMACGSFYSVPIHRFSLVFKSINKRQTAFGEYTVRRCMCHIGRSNNVRRIMRNAKRLCEERSKVVLYINVRFRKEEMAKPIAMANKFTVPTQNGKLILDIGNVIRLQSDNNYTKVYLKERQLLVTKTLKRFEVLLTSHPFRVYQSYMVNLLEVKEYPRSEGGFVRMSDGEEVPVSRANKGALEQVLNRYIEGC